MNALKILCLLFLLSFISGCATLPTGTGLGAPSVTTPAGGGTPPTPAGGPGSVAIPVRRPQHGGSGGATQSAQNAANNAGNSSTNSTCATCCQEWLVITIERETKWVMASKGGWARKSLKFLGRGDWYVTTGTLIVEKWSDVNGSKKKPSYDNGLS